MIQTDKKLISRCQSGDTSAFEELFELVKRDIYGISYSILKNHDDVEDAVNETFIRVYKYIKNLKDLEKFPAWLKRITANQCFSILKKRSKIPHELLEEDEYKIKETVWSNNNENNPRARMMRQDVFEAIDRAMKTLPPKQQVCITLFDVQGNSIKEIAEVLKCSEGAVKFNIHQAREKLKRILKPLDPKKNKPETLTEVSS